MDPEQAMWICAPRSPLKMGPLQESRDELFKFRPPGKIPLVSINYANERFVPIDSGNGRLIDDDFFVTIGKYRIGLKAAYDLYPRELKDRMLKDFKEKNWSAIHQPALAEATKKLQQFEADSSVDKALKEEYELRLEILTKMEKNYTDLGPAFDCVLWNDGSSWKAGKDTFI